MDMIQINLLPIEYRSSKADLTFLADRKIIWSTIALIVVVSALLLGATLMNDRIMELQSERDRLQAQVDREKPLKQKIKQLKEKLEIIGKKNNALKSIQVSKKRWVIIFENISSILPPNMWLESITQSSDYLLEVKGVTYDFSEIAEYMVKLESQISVDNVQLLSISKIVQDSENAYRFQLKCKVNRDLGLESAL